MKQLRAPPPIPANSNREWVALACPGLRAGTVPGTLPSGPPGPPPNTTRGGRGRAPLPHTFSPISPPSPLLPPPPLLLLLLSL